MDAMAVMVNPWLRLPTEPPFVLPEDLPGAVPFQLHCRIPEPWTGPIRRADVVLLLKNSGHALQDIADLGRPEFVTALRRQFGGEEPFLYALPEWGQTSGGEYWRRRLRVVIEEVGAERVAGRFAVAQAVPYASSYQIEPMGPIPSAAFTGELVRQAHRRGALVIVGRARREWRELVPELFANGEPPTLGRPRAVPNMTPKRLGQDLFGQVLARLR